MRTRRIEWRPLDSRIHGHLGKRRGLEGDGEGRREGTFWMEEGDLKGIRKTGVQEWIS